MLWDIRNGRVPLGDTFMSYVAFGRGEKAFIILPGLSDGLATVDGKALLLAWPYRAFFKRYTVYIFSRKERLEENCSIRDMAEDQAAALLALGIQKASVMGVSMGGMIALSLAQTHPERVERLVIALSVPRVNDMIRDNVTKWIAFAEKGDHKGLMIDTAEKSYSERKLRSYRKLYPVLGAVGRPRDYMRFLISARAILGFDAYEDLEKIKCPALIIGGAEDRIVGIGASYEMRDRIPGSDLYVYPGLGHAAYEEAPCFNGRVLSFLEGGGA